MLVLGIDIGGSGVKGAPVDTRTGELQAERFRLATPQPAKPQAVAGTVQELVAHFQWQGPVGCTMPAVVQHGVVLTAANIDESWIGVDGEALLGEVLGTDVTLLNDADAAGMAEMEWGAGRGRQGTVIVLTFGTGIGSAIFVDGQLVPNTEFGHMTIRGKAAEHRAANSVREEKGLKWDRWAERVHEFLTRMEGLFWPDLFIIGGGVSRKHEKFLPLIEVQAQIVPAKMFNQAGLAGAALAARRRQSSGSRPAT